MEKLLCNTLMEHITSLYFKQVLFLQMIRLEFIATLGKSFSPGITDDIKQSSRKSEGIPDQYPEH